MNIFYEIGADIENGQELISHTCHLPDGFLFTPHYHEGIEILCFFDGKGCVELDGESFEVKKGDIVVFNSKQVHSVIPQEEIAYYCVIIKKSFLKKYNFPYKEKYILSKINDTEIADYCKILCIEKSSELEWHKEKLHAYLLLTAIKLYCSYIDEEKSKIKNNTGNKTNLVISVMDYISDNYERSISIEEIASNIGYSKYYLCRTFKELTNQTIIEYINRLKCSKAIDDLKSGKYTVYETANKYGFENFSYFSEIFRKYTGSSPSFFKKK